MARTPNLEPTAGLSLNDLIVVYDASGDETLRCSISEFLDYVTANSGVVSGSFAPVNDIVALKAINTTSATTWFNWGNIRVGTSGLFYLDRNSTLPGDDVNVVQPTAGVGRWIKDTGAIVSDFAYDSTKVYDSISGDSSTYAEYGLLYWKYINSLSTTQEGRESILGTGNGVPSENAFWTEVSKSDLDSIYNADLIKVGGKAYVQRFGALCFTASGTDTYTATTTVGPTVLNNKLRIWVRFTNANTGASTFNWNSLGAKAIVKNGSEALIAGDIKAGQILQIGYDDSGNWQIIGGLTNTIDGGTA